MRFSDAFLMLAIKRLTLTDFRNYEQLVWEPGARLCVITGPNGSGKTNLLEAVSLLSPGRGLRGARMAALARLGGSGRWAVAGRLAEGDGPSFDVGTGTLGDGPADRRVFRVDGVEPRTQAEVAARVSAVWLTPQMDGLFQESASGRRRFLDRLVWALEPDHARQAGAYDTAMASRNKLLAQRHVEAAWVTGLEESMARHAVALAAARGGFVRRLNGARLPSGGFPRAELALLDPIAARLADAPALAVEEWLKGVLAANRGVDAAAGGATVGAHKADLAMRDAVSLVPAGQASTGQQKALLIGIMLAHAALIAEARATSPFLLLDEPLVHLDGGRRSALFEALVRLPGTVLLTGTDADVFAPLRDEAAFYSAKMGRLE